MCGDIQERHRKTVNNREFITVINRAKWLNCDTCESTMPFETIYMNGIGIGFACMQCGFPSKETTEIIVEVVERKLRLL